MPTSSGLAPTISATGISAGTFAQWQAYLIAQYQAIFGADAYLGNDSQDGEFIGVMAQALADVCASAVAVYNSFSPASAQKAGLSSVVKINGLQRLSPSFSTATGTIVGVAGTVISNGQAQDANGNIWLLPSTVTIPSGGTVSVTLTCATAGAILAAATSINKIRTPVYGWQTVNNAAAAAAGSAVETDAALRIRQGQSVALPSQTIFEGIVAAIEQVSGVTRAKGYENNTASTDANGTAARTLYFIVEGGTSAAIFAALAPKVTPGIPLRGAVTTTFTDTNGSTRSLAYDTPTNATITVALTVHALPGWSTGNVALIQQALVNFLETLPIGANISYTGIMVPAYLANVPAAAGTYNITALTIKKNAGSAVSADVQLAYNEAAVAALSNIVVTVA